MIGNAITVFFPNNTGPESIFTVEEEGICLQAIVGKHGELRVQEISEDFNTQDQPTVVRIVAVFAPGEWGYYRNGNSNLMENDFDF